MENKPVLKKVRRPINRAQPLSSSNPKTNDEAVHNIPDNNVDTGYNQAQENDVSDFVAPKPQPMPATNNSPIANLPSTERAQHGGYNQFSPQYDDNSEYIRDEFEEEYYADAPQGISVKLFVVCFVVALIVGALLGKYLLGETQVAQNGLQGVVANTEVPRGRARCGVADRTQGCVLYIMNPQRQNVKAKSFYDMAAQMTGRQRFMIETGNMRYANTDIRPGDIAQLNIPPL